MAESESIANTRRKALKINLEPHIYGSLSEIGAGQEVARQFFQAGGASGTVAKTLSAYDMQMSDAIYGADASGRYVTRGRLESMLDREYSVLIDRVRQSRSPESTYLHLPTRSPPRRTNPLATVTAGWASNTNSPPSAPLCKSSSTYAC